MQKTQNSELADRFQVLVPKLITQTCFDLTLNIDSYKLSKVDFKVILLVFEFMLKLQNVTIHTSSCKVE
jgi:hypothetical protein